MVNFALKRSFKWFTNVKAMRLRAMCKESRDNSSDPYFLINILTKALAYFSVKREIMCVCACVCTCVCMGVGAGWEGRKG